MRRYARYVLVYFVSVLVLIAMLPLVLFIGVGLFAWHVPARPPRGERLRKVIVIVPAHNEESVIQGILADLRDQDYEQGLVDVHVIADRCTDGTAAAAGEFATVHERSEGQGTKGAAVGWLIESLTINDEDIVVIFDADARIGHDVVGSLSDGADQGFRVMQMYLGTSNPDSSYVALAGALSQWMSNRLIDLPRRNLGMSSSLLGTGMAMTGDLAPVLTNTGLGITEDQALSDNFAIEGVRVVWLHRVRVIDENPTSLEVLVRQRSRWAKGRSVGRRESLRALTASGGIWSPSRVNRVLRLVLPGRMISAAFLAIVMVLAFIWPGILAFSPWYIVVLLGVVFVMSVAALVVEGAGWSRILKAPLVALLALTWVPERLVGRRNSDWYHTPHDGAHDA